MAEISLVHMAGKSEEQGDGSGVFNPCLPACPWTEAELTLLKWVHRAEAEGGEN